MSIRPWLRPPTVIRAPPTRGTHILVAGPPAVPTLLDAPTDHASEPAQLTPREFEVLKLITKGSSNQEIADELYLSINSIKTYVRSAYRKIQVTRRVEAVKWGIHHMTGSDPEADRMGAVARYGILDTPPDGAFDRIAALAARWFDVPIATVSIVDTDRIWFKATHGLDGVAQLGRDAGLCASAILQDAPYHVEDALNDPRVVGNPLVHGDLGVQFYAAAPLITPDGHRLGTVNVLDTVPRVVSERDLAVLVDLAAIVMDELEIRLSALVTLRHERWQRHQVEEFAETLQRTLLPPALPEIPGLDLACHYHAASRVGGDFYDVFFVGRGRWAFFLGDVQGHGAEAAVVTSHIRYTLRASALHHHDPVDALADLNRSLLQEPSADRFCTVVFGILEPHPAGDGWRVTIASGGHLPALRIRTTEGVVEAVGPTGGMLVGVTPEASFSQCGLHLRAGETLMFYTDGLTENRSADGRLGQEGLVAQLEERRPSGAQATVRTVVRLIEEMSPTDDVAVLALSPATHPAK